MIKTRLFSTGCCLWLALLPLSAAASSSPQPAPTAMTSLADSKILYFKSAGGGPATQGPRPNNDMLVPYGTVDMLVSYQRRDNEELVRLQSGGSWTSKLGLYGQKDLIADWTGFFRLEGGIDLNQLKFQNDHGSLKRFNRGHYLGLANPEWGRLSYGRQMSGSGALSTFIDPFGYSAKESLLTYMTLVGDLGYGASSPGVGRIDNSLSYVSPRMQGVSFNLFYAHKGEHAAGVNKTHARSVGIDYLGASDLYAFSATQSWCDPSARECRFDRNKEPDVRTDSYQLFYSHHFNPTLASTLMLQYTRPQDAASMQVYSMGLSKVIDNNVIRASLVYRDTSIAGNQAYGAMVGNEYYFYRNIASIYMTVAYLNNGSASRVLFNVDSSRPNYSLMPKRGGENILDTAIGITYHF